MVGNFDLKEEIRDYRSRQPETFDLAFGHRIASSHEAGAVLGPFSSCMPSCQNRWAFSGDMREYEGLKRRKPHCLSQQLDGL